MKDRAVASSSPIERAAQIHSDERQHVLVVVDGGHCARCPVHAYVPSIVSLAQACSPQAGSAPGLVASSAVVLSQRVVENGEGPST